MTSTNDDNSDYYLYDYKNDCYDYCWLLLLLRLLMRLFLLLVLQLLLLLLLLITPLSIVGLRQPRVCVCRQVAHPRCLWGIRASPDVPLPRWLLSDWSSELSYPWSPEEALLHRKTNPKSCGKQSRNEPTEKPTSTMKPCVCKHKKKDRFNQH